MMNYEVRYEGVITVMGNALVLQQPSLDGKLSISSIFFNYRFPGGGALGTHKYGGVSPIFWGQMLTPNDIFWSCKKDSIQL